MENDFFVEEQRNVNADIDQLKEMTDPATYYRYTKEELLDIKELPRSNKRPQCLSEKYFVDGAWDPEKWHDSLCPTSRCSSPLNGFNYGDDRISLKCRISDPPECPKENNLDAVLSSQGHKSGGGGQGNAAPHTDRPTSPLGHKDESFGGARRIGSGRIAARALETCAEKEREHERDFKDKRFRRDVRDKQSERRRNDSCVEEEPEWFAGGPTCQSETIELTGFDDEVLEDDKFGSQMPRKHKVSLKEAVERTGGREGEPCAGGAPTVDKEFPNSLPERSAGEFDLNKLLNLKTTPGVSSLTDVPASATCFSQWFSSNHGPSNSRSTSLSSPPFEELGGLAEDKEKVDILEILHKAKIDLKPLLSSLSVNKARLHESTNSGMVLSLEEVEGEMKGMKVRTEQQAQKVSPPQKKAGTPFMAEHLKESLTSGSHDPEMSAFNKLVSSMKASGTLPPSHPKVNSHNPSSSAALVPLPEVPVQQKNIFQELLGGQGPRSNSPPLASLLSGSDSQTTSIAPLHAFPYKGTSSPAFSQQTASPDYFNRYLSPSSGFPVVPRPMTTDTFTNVHTPINPGSTPQMRALSMTAGYTKQPQDKALRNRK